jgi:acetyl-CoA C-acetyltransferase
MKKNKDVCVVGYAQTPVGKSIEGTFVDLATRVSADAIRASGLPKGTIQGLLITHEGFGNFINAQIFAPRLARHLGLETRFLGTFECGGMSAAVAVKIAATEMMMGRLDSCLVVGVELRPRFLGDPAFDLTGVVDQTAGLYGAYEFLYGLTGPLPFYAMSQQRWMLAHNLQPEDIAPLPVLLRQNASKNPMAQFRDPIGVEDVLNSRMVCPPIRLLECCTRSEGAAAVLLARRDIARETGDSRISIKGFGEAHDPTHFFPYRGDAGRFPCVERSAREAYEDAGIDPRDLDVAEIYGAFAGTELMIYEEMGFFERGQAHKAVKDGVTAIDGEFPINPSGGRISLGHPPGATPLLELIEVCAQLRGEAGNRQIRDPVLGLIQGEHGMVNGSVVLVLEREA